MTSFPLNWRHWMFDLADPRHMMETVEFERFTTLPDKLKIYRGGGGVTANKLKYGMCWTTNIDQATWFADGFTHLGNPVVIEAIVDKENIYGCFDYEEEVIIKGGRVSNLRACKIDYSAFEERWKEKCSADRTKHKELLKEVA